MKMSPEEFHAHTAAQIENNLAKIADGRAIPVTIESSDVYGPMGWEDDR
jgi:hypothetical protein